jgi:hypothetical protein
VIDVMKTAREQQSKLPFDRRGLLALPVPARDESRTEYQRSKEWKNRFADRFAEYYKDWLPIGRTPADVLDLLRIPYVPFWSFGERLPVVEEGAGDPASLRAAYEVLARLIDTDLEWDKVLSGEIIGEPVSRTERPFNSEWLRRQRTRARDGLVKTESEGFMEIYFYSPSAIINQPQDELLGAARSAAVTTSKWPIGLVSDRDDERPRPTGEGIVAEIESTSSWQNTPTYDYWCLTKQGDFYSLMSLFEDRRRQNKILSNTRIERTTETLLYCSKLYRALGANGNTSVRLTINYGGLKGRILDIALNFFPLDKQNLFEDEVSTEISFVLQDLERDLVDLVQQLCTPLFLLFDFQRFDRNVYEQRVNDFVNGKVA